MDIIKHEGVKYHVKCGGVVIRGVCVKCGEKRKGLMRRILGEEPLIIKEEDVKAIERKAHRKRLRDRKDIFK